MLVLEGRWEFFIAMRAVLISVTDIARPADGTLRKLGRLIAHFYII